MTETRRPEGFYKEILDNMLEGCQILGFDWRYIYLNHTAQQHNRRPNAELIGKVYAEMWPGVEKTEVFRLIKLCLEERQPQAMENEFTFPDGRKGWFELRISPVPEGVFIMSLDISSRKQMEETLRKTEEQFRQAQKLEAIGMLAGGVAHDFNNILGVILGHAELGMNRINKDQPVFSDLHEIHQAALRSAEITRQLLAFARKQTIAPKVVNINQLIDGILKFLRRLIGEDITLSWCPGVTLYPVKMDPCQVEQILTNLCINARDAISSTGEITIETSNASLDQAYCDQHSGFLPGEFVIITVSDTGCGMDKDTLSRLFDPFFTTKGLGHGTGLGLATVYGIIKQNNGFINVYSEPGKGTTFKIYLARDLGTPVEIKTSSFDELISRGSETILLVEDDPGILQITHTILESLGYHVLAAASPNQALITAGQYPGKIHLLLSDVVMPEMTGPMLAEKIAALSPDTRHLFVSGYTPNVIAKRGILKTGVHFLQKPFSRRQLSEKIRETLADDNQNGKL